ncbi:hypothetical protein HNR62_000143 [Oceanisphaera litoralis]|uniref:hypothetical protein n=1 Tax=Oceanisphaera litoralis TaxID=225144 RepID=UPI00195E00D0|nr:hypothetical protein [Oceanisphaera litoralis]MBM7454319.1 hypothetical protein [Oceanisphaera litoralis]
MKTNIFIDNNAWDIFVDQNLDLSVELPPEEFNLKITREAEFEILQMPKEKREYVERYISQKTIKTDSFFGFYDESLPPNEQRNGGFDVGRFIDPEEARLIQGETIGPSKRPTGLLKNEADVSLAARSLHSFVITCDGKKALKRAKENSSGKIIDLKKYIPGTSLYSFIKAEIGFLNS